MQNREKNLINYFQKIYYIFGNFGKVGFELTENTGKFAATRVSKRREQNQKKECNRKDEF